MELLTFLRKPKSRRKLFVLRRVMGESMMPALAPGKVVLGVRPRRLTAGDVVIVRHGGLEKIKRVRMLDTGKVFLTGDNRAHSTDSHDFGWLEMASIVAKVVWPNLKQTEN